MPLDDTAITRPEEDTAEALRQAVKMMILPVEAVGSGADANKVKVRIPGEEALTVDLPYAEVFGAMPIVGANVLTLLDATVRRVITSPPASTVKAGRKSADQSFTTTTFADVTGLSFNYGPNEEWEFTFNIMYKADPNDDLKAFPNVTGVANLYYTGFSLDTAAISVPGNLQHREPVVFSTTPITAGGPSSATTTLLVIKGVVMANASGGTINIRAAKNVASSANNMVITLFSNYVAHKLN